MTLRISSKKSLVERILEVIESGRPRFGVDFDADTIPEWDICQELGIEIVTGVGAGKQWSSSLFLEAWAQTAR